MYKPLSLLVLLTIIIVNSIDVVAMHFSTNPGKGVLQDVVMVDLPNSKLENYKQTIPNQENVIDVNWLHTMNPLAGNIHGRLIWSSTDQQGMASFFGLTETSQSQHYQLLAYDLISARNQPVSLMKFKVKMKELIILSLKPKTIVERPYKFELVLIDNKKSSNQPLLMAQP
jgi:hypothetical protein